MLSKVNNRVEFRIILFEVNDLAQPEYITEDITEHYAQFSVFNLTPLIFLDMLLPISYREKQNQILFTSN